MAKKFLTSIDLNQNELQYAVVHALATAPATGSTGQIYFNTSDNYLYQYYNSAWHAVGVTNTYSLDNGQVSSNKVPIRLYENGTVKNTIYIEGAGGAWISQSNGTITITTDDTTYSIAGNWSSGYLSYDIIMTDVAGNNYTAEIPMASLSPANPGLMTSDMALKLNGIETGAEVNVQADWNVTDTSSDSYIRNKPTIPEGVTPSSTTPKMDGTAAVGTETAFARGDHVHPKDTSKANLASPTFTGTPKAPTAAAGTNTTQIATTAFVTDAVSTGMASVDAMRFKGTIGTGGTVTTLPTSGVKVGDTYRVITAGSYAGETCEIGDLIMATATTPTWTVAQTNIDGAITDISGTAPLSSTGSGHSRTISISAASGSAAGSMSSAHYTKLEGIESGAQVNRTYTATTGKPTGNQTPGFGSTFTISQISQSTTGQVSATDRTVTIPNTTATTSAAGLMSATDKTNLNSLNTHLNGVTKGTATISTSALSTTISVDTHVIAYTAYMDDKEVVIDYDDDTCTFSVTTNPASAITIVYLAY